MKKTIYVLMVVGFFLIGAVPQVLGEDTKTEGITSETSLSVQSEQSFFSQDNSILLAAYEKNGRENDRYKDRDEDRDHDRDRDRDNPDCSKLNSKACERNHHCSWISKNSKPGRCVSSRH
jgi:hypothetical protein